MLNVFFSLNISFSSVFLLFLLTILKKDKIIVNIYGVLNMARYLLVFICGVLGVIQVFNLINAINNNELVINSLIHLI